MIVFWYLGIILLCYGTFHLICYLQIFPTQKSSALMLHIGNMTGLSWFDVMAFLAAEKLKTKYELEWKYENQATGVFRMKGINTDGTTFFLGKIIAYLMGVMLLLPLCFMKIRVFCILFSLWTIARVWDVFRLFKSDFSKEKKQKHIFYSSKLLMGAYFIGQIIVFAVIFT